MDKNEKALLSAGARARLDQQDAIQKIIARQKSDNLAAVLAGQISVEVWISRIHKTNRELKLSQGIVRDIRKEVGRLSMVDRPATVGRFSVGVQ